MRIVAVADTHLFERDLGNIPEGDVFIHAGDLLRGGDHAELSQGASWLRGLPHRHKIFVAGNHETCFEEDRLNAVAQLGPGVAYLQDTSCEIEGVHFYGSPWQPAHNNWAFNLPRGEALREKWEQIPGCTDVLITHGPPSGVFDRSPTPGRGGCTDLLSAVHRVNPALHLYGHIHQDGGFLQGKHTAFCNVTTWECERGPTVLDLDPATMRVAPLVIPPRTAIRNAH